MKKDDNQAKGNFDLSRAFFGESQRPVKWFSNQISSFRQGTHQSFLIYWKLTLMLHYRIQGFLTDGMISSEVFSKLMFYLGAMKTNLYANISNGALVPFTPF